jgi:4-carboxymuconolactone decarboxylase
VSHSAKRRAAWGVTVPSISTSAVGRGGPVDIIGGLGNFSMLAMLLNTFQVDLKPGDAPPSPGVCGFAKVGPDAAGQ